MSLTEKLGRKSLMRWSIMRSPLTRCAAGGDLKHQDQTLAFMKYIYGILYRHYVKQWGFKDEANPSPAPHMPQSATWNWM